MSGTATRTEAPVRIVVGRQSNGLVFRLDTRDRDEAPPAAQALGNVFVGYETRGDVEAIRGPIWEQVALLITQMKPAELRRRGYRFVEPVDETVIFEKAPS